MIGDVDDAASIDWKKIAGRVREGHALVATAKPRESGKTKARR